MDAYGEWYSNPEQDIVLGRVVTQIDKSQELLLKAGEQWARLPTSKRFGKFVETLNLSCQVFSSSAEGILNSGKLTNDEKAGCLASLILNADDERIRSFRRIAPSAQFEETPRIQSELSQQIQELMEDDEDSGLSELIDMYGQNLEVDVQSFLSAIQENPRAKRINQAKKIGRESLGIGKVVLAGVVGGIVAAQIIRKP